MARPTSSSRVPNIVSSSVLTVLVSFCLIVPALFGSASGQQSSGQQYTVGGTNYWTVVPDDPNFFDKWQAQYTFKVGDELDFEYPDSTSVVVQVSEADYQTCTTGKNAILVGTEFETRLSINRGDGILYIIDSNPAYCKEGLKVKIPVVDESVQPSSSKPLVYVSKGSLLAACLALVAILSDFILS